MMIFKQTQFASFFITFNQIYRKVKEIREYNLLIS